MKRPPPVPPLAESALARIERGVFAALDARPLAREATRDPRVRVLVLALAGAAAAGAIFVARDRRHGDAAPASTAQLTTTTSGSHIAVTGAALEVAPQSAVSFGAGRNGAFVVVLDRGTVTCEVAPRSNRAPFIVEAGETRVTVIGTRFSVHRVGAHATVSVEHGLVEVADTNMTELVHAGERFRPGEPVAREALESEAAPPAATSPAVAIAPAPPTLASAASAVSSTPPTPRARAEHRRRVSIAARADDVAEVEPTKPREVTATLASDAPAAPVSAAAPEAPAMSAPPQAAGAPPRSVQVLFELAAQLEVRDPEAALRIYGELAAGDGGWAASALFASARLEGERGQPARARALCATYLERFPRGPNADDARALLSPSR